MERTKFTFVSCPNWLSTLLVVVFGFVGIHQASAQLTLDVLDGGGNPVPATQTFTPPEGVCGVDLQYVAEVFDTTDVTVTATITNPNLGVFPTADVQQNGASTAGFANFTLTVQAAVGTNTLTVTATSDSGDALTETYTIEVVDARVPEIYAPDVITLDIPECDADGMVPLNYNFSVVDDCDIQPAITVTGPASGTLVDASTTVTITATDDFGNTSSKTIEVVVNQVPQDIVLALNGNTEYNIPACESSADILISGTVIDCNLSATDDTATVSGYLNAPVSYIEVEDGFAYFELEGFAGAPGPFTTPVTYDNGVNGPVTVTFNTIVNQDADQPADIIMPGNLSFLAPACSPGALVKFSVQLTDDCDADLSGATFTLNGGAAPAIDAGQSDPANGLYVWELADIPAGDYVLEGTYTDGGGNTTTKAVTLTVTDQPDDWAPIIVYPAQDINVDLDPCLDGPAIIFFEVTATDNCDGDIGASVFFAPGVNDAIVLPSAGGPTVGVAAFPGSYQVLIEATDAAGNTRQEDFFINVTQDPKPVDNLGCNDNVIVTLDDNCQAEIGADLILEGAFGCLDPTTDFDILVGDGDQSNGNIADGVGTFPVNVMIGGGPQPVSGFTGPFAPANWTVIENDGGSVDISANTMTLETADGGGFCFGGSSQFATIAVPFDGLLSFDWDYSTIDAPFFDQFIAVIDAAGNITTLVDIDSGPNNQSGSVTDVPVTAGSILVFEAFSTDCILGPAIIDITNFSYVPATGGDTNFTMCQGTITTVDKTDPDVVCPDDTDEALIANDFQEINGTLEDGDAELVITDYSCFLEVLGGTGTPGNPDGETYFYDVCTFTPDRTDVYTFFMESSWGAAAGGGLGSIYVGDFDPNSPCSNVIYQNDQVFGNTLTTFLISPNNPFDLVTTNFDPIVRMSLPLEAGQTYTLVTTSTLPQTTGDYTWTIFSDGNGELDGACVTGSQPAVVSTPLLCDDLDLVLLDVSPATYEVDADGNPIITSQTAGLINQLRLTGLPDLSETCGGATVTVSDQVTTPPGDCVQEDILLRTFVIEDASGNQVVCEQEITFRRPNITDVVFPPYTAYLECDESFPVDANGNPDPSATGYPFIQTASGFIDLNTTYCNISADYSDFPRIDVCEDSYKLVRLWNIIDMCDPANSAQFQQIIQVGDFTAPTVVCPASDHPNEPVLTISTSPFDCEADFQVPLPDVTDNCSSGNFDILTQIVTDIEVDSLDVFGQPTGVTTTETIIVATIGPNDNRFVTGIPVGDHRFRYTVEDGCGNAAVVECPFRVRDRIEPVAVCDDDLNISIGGGGIARVYAEDIDEGSWDNCDDIVLEVRRFVSLNPDTIFEYESQTGIDVEADGFTEWGPYVDFICLDVNSMVTIELRVWDDANKNGVFGDWYGNVPQNPFGPEDAEDNFNICWLEVLIEDKLNPFCKAPNPVTISCEDLPFDFDIVDTAQLQTLFGTAKAQDNCNAFARELDPDISNYDPTCNSGFILRRFQARDQFGNVSTNSCQQQIFVTPVTNYEIRFPADAEETCGGMPDDTLAINDLGCGTPFAVEIEDDTLKVPGAPECFKIFRKYEVINWCEYDGISPPVVVSRDEDCDGVPGDEDIWVLVRPNPGVTPGTRFWGGGGQFDPNNVGSYNWRANQDPLLNLHSTITYFDRDNDETQWQTPTILDDVPRAFRKGNSCDGLSNPAGYWINSLMDGDATRNPITGDMEPEPGQAPGQQGESDMNDKIRNIASVGYWEYTQILKVYDDVPPVVEFDDLDPFPSLDNVDCDGPVSYPFTVNENCTQNIPDPIVRLDAFADGVIDDGLFEAFDGEVTGSFPDYTITGEFPIGQHAFVVFVSDGCGNEAQRTIPFEVVDAKAPAPICIFGEAIELMPLEPDTDADGDGDVDDGANTIWALDYINSPFDDCSDTVFFSINRVGEPNDPTREGLTVTCDDLADGGTVMVEIWAYDGTGNGGDFCETFLLVQDNMNVCGDTVPDTPAVVAGVLATETGNGLQSADVQLSGNGNVSAASDVDGAYGFTDVIQGYDYTITPQHDVDYLNGVSTFDLVLISKHILQIDPLDSPYKRIAADANRSGTITTLDLLQLRQMILNVEPELPSNTSWRFVDQAYGFTSNTPEAENFPEVININDLSGDMMANDFVAVKIGDVNGSAVVNSNQLSGRTLAGTFDLRGIL